MPGCPGRGRSERVDPTRLGSLVVAAVDELVVVGPPDLVVGGGRDLADDLVRDRASERRVQMRRSVSVVRRSGVLRLPARDPPQVLPPAVHQCGEVDRVPRGPPVVVGGRVHGCAVADAGRSCRT